MTLTKQSFSLGFFALTNLWRMLLVDPTYFSAYHIPPPIKKIERDGEKNVRGRVK
jgi:hypothetical protein